MNTKEITAKVIELLERSEPLPGDDLEGKLAYRYLDAGHIDSFAIINLIVEIEDTFGVSLSTEATQSDTFRTVGGIVTLVSEQLAI